MAYGTNIEKLAHLKYCLSENLSIPIKEDYQVILALKCLASLQDSERSYNDLMETVNENAKHKPEPSIKVYEFHFVESDSGFEVYIDDFIHYSVKWIKNNQTCEVTEGEQS